MLVAASGEERRARRQLEGNRELCALEGVRRDVLGMEESNLLEEREVEDASILRLIHATAVDVENGLRSTWKTTFTSSSSKQLRRSFSSFPVSSTELSTSLRSVPARVAYSSCLSLIATCFVFEPSPPRICAR
mgnify:FL=1